jgi:hypothetical protein
MWMDVMSIFWPAMKCAIPGPVNVGVNKYGVGGIGGVPVSVGVGVADVSNVGVSVGGGSNVGVSVAGKVTWVSGKLHENNNRHSTANFETRRNLAFIPDLLN